MPDNGEGELLITLFKTAPTDLRVHIITASHYLPSVISVGLHIDRSRPYDKIVLLDRKPTITAKKMSMNPDVTSYSWNATKKIS